MQDRNELQHHDISNLVPKHLQHLFENCRLTAHPSVLNRITFLVQPKTGKRIGSSVTINSPDFAGKLTITLGPGTTSIKIDSDGPIQADIKAWNDSTLTIGEGTTINGARIICANGDVVIGRDGLWSDEVILQSHDQHGIVDLTTKQVINQRRRKTVIHDHVWPGRRTLLMPDVEIGTGSVLGAGSTLTKDMPPQTIWAGTPARLVRADVTWSRSSSGFSKEEEAKFGDIIEY